MDGLMAKNMVVAENGVSTDKDAAAPWDTGDCIAVVTNIHGRDSCTNPADVDLSVRLSSTPLTLEPSLVTAVLLGSAYYSQKIDIEEIGTLEDSRSGCFQEGNSRQRELNKVSRGKKDRRETAHLAAFKLFLSFSTTARGPNFWHITNAAEDNTTCNDHASAIDCACVEENEDADVNSRINEVFAKSYVAEEDGTVVVSDRDGVTGDNVADNSEIAAEDNGATQVESAADDEISSTDVAAAIVVVVAKGKEKRNQIAIMVLKYRLITCLGIRDGVKASHMRQFGGINPHYMSA